MVYITLVGFAAFFVICAVVFAAANKTSNAYAFWMAIAMTAGVASIGLLFYSILAASTHKEMHFHPFVGGTICLVVFVVSFVSLRCPARQTHSC